MSQSVIHKPSLKPQTASNAGVEARDHTHSNGPTAGVRFFRHLHTVDTM